MNDDDKPPAEIPAEDDQTSRREVLRKARPLAYVAPGMILLAVPAKAQLGSPPPPPG